MGASSGPSAGREHRRHGLVSRSHPRSGPPSPRCTLSTRPRIAAALLALLLIALVAPSAASGTEPVAPEVDPAPTARTVPPPASGDGPATALEVVADRPAFDRSADRTGWTRGSAVDLDPFTLIGLDLGPEGAERAAEVRVHTHAGWGAWFEVEAHNDHGPDPGGEATTERRTTDPVWVGLANGYEVRLPADLDPTQVEVLRVVDTGRPVPAAEPPAVGPTSRQPNTAQPTMRLRSSWGASPYRGQPEVADTLGQAVVHHSVTASWYSAAQVPGILRSIQAFHQDGNGWYDIAYNFAIDRYGTIWEARQGGVHEAIIGGHTRGFNTASTGVVVLGDFTTVVPSAAMINAVGDLIGWKLHQHGVDPASTGQVVSYGSDEYPAGTVVTRPRVSGHRDFSATGCPGQQVYNRLSTIRARAAAIYQGQLAQQPSPGMVPIVGDFQGDGEDDVLLYRPGTGADVLIRGDRTVPFRRLHITINGTYRTVVGDFDGNGADDILFDGHGPHGDSIWYGLRTGGFTTRDVYISGTPDLHVGDFDGDGRDDLLLYGRGPEAADAIWYGRAWSEPPVPVDEAPPIPSLLFDTVVHAINGHYEPLIGDYDGDGRHDIVWYGAGSGSDALWWGSPTRAFTPGGVDIKGIYQPLVGDFDGDRRDDILWYGSGSSPDAMWWGGPDRRFTSAPIAINGRYLPFVGEFSGNRIDDVLWLTAGQASGSLWLGRPGGVFAPRIVQPLS